MFFIIINWMNQRWLGFMRAVQRHPNDPLQQLRAEARANPEDDGLETVLIEQERQQAERARQMGT